MTQRLTSSKKIDPKFVKDDFLINIFFYKIYKFLKTLEGTRVRRITMQYQNQPDLEVGDINWSLTAKNVPGKPRKLTKSWTGPWVVEAKAAGVLYRIKPYNDGNSFPPHHCACEQA